MTKIGTYKIESFPRFREIVIESVEAGKKMNHVIGIFEMDVTEAREIIRHHKEKTGEQLSFTAWMIKCVAQAVNENKEMHGIRKGRRKVVIFDDVNVRCNIEKELDGKKIATMYVVRKANEKSLQEIHQEIRKAQGKGEVLEKTSPVKSKKSRDSQKLLISLPKFVRRIIWWKLRKDPFFIQKNIGTVGVTSLGMMFKSGTGWAITSSPHTLSVAIGSIIEKPGVINKSIEIREYLGLTIMFNHDVVDGAPAARFSARLTELLDTGYGLEDFKK